MGTRADFYIGQGKTAEWIGSVGCDGYPDAMIDSGLLAAPTAEDFRRSVAVVMDQAEEYATRPEQGWPWPWDDSQTTDFAYCFVGTEGQRVLVFCFGRPFDINESEDDRADRQDAGNEPRKAEFPNMMERKNVTLGTRSGAIFIGVLQGSDEAQS